MTQADSRRIVNKLEEQLDRARAEREQARTELDILLGELIGDLHKNLGRYIMDNVKREIRKRPDNIRRLDDSLIASLREDLAALAAAEAARIVDAVRNDPEWYHPDVEILDNRSNIWKTIQSVEAPANKRIKKFGLAPINIRNWSWLSDHLAILANDRYPAEKRLYIEKNKWVEYLEKRLGQETRMLKAMDRIEEL